MFSLAGSTRSVQLSWSENPYHIGAFVDQNENKQG